MTRVLTVIMLMIFSMGAKADVKVEIGKFNGGTIVEKGQTDPDDKGLVTVTITVTPDKGFTISQKDIVVVSTYAPEASGTRSPQVAAELTPIEKDPEDLSEPRDYSYIVSSTFGVWVKEANFKKVEDSSKGPVRSVTISNLGEITDPEGSYTLASGFSTTGTRATNESGKEIGSVDNPFKGTVDGGLVPITGTWDKPLFDYVDGATIKNVIIETASVSGSACVGAIAGTAKGASRIYNCGILSGSVGSTGNATDNPKTANACGGLVGLLDGTARVINCYSYATITGGNRVGGIVGYNNKTTTAGSINTMVMNCMFYGDITGGNKVSPVYGGNNISNLNNGKTDGTSGLNTFNYYAYDKLKTKAISDASFYNCTLAVEGRFLTRFEFYRQLLNSNKKLAAIYITGNADDANLLAKWVLETADRNINDPKPYPILKAQGTYPSIINIDAEHAPSTSERNKGGITGTLSVTIQNSTSGGQSAPAGANISETLTLNRTDKDEDRFNFNYDKVQLPYYNDYGTGNYTEGKVVTGWKIISMTTVGEGDDVATEGKFTPKDEWNGYNFADRKSYAKDLYRKSGRVFSQGAYFDVPYGVTGITIEPYWGNAAYITDPNYDVVYNTSYSRQNVSQLGTQVENNTTFGGKTVKTSINDALGTISSPGLTVYDNAIVLVGNFHQNVINKVEPFNSSTTPFTLMSVDLDNDHEPDYSLIFHDNNRSRVNPIRFDFLNIPGTAQAQKPWGTSTILNASVFNASAWFEITNTCLIYFSQFEYENSGKTKDKSPIILHGGVFDQFTSTKVNQVQNTTYLHVGGNAWFKEFGNGTHSDGSKKTKHIPISVTGGDYDGFYLTGTYNSNAAVYSDNAECYISGGHFKELAGAGLEQIDGNVQWQIYDADIDNFFGGGINDAKPILGTITTEIYYSHVGTFCGGPKFGNMASGKKVTTTAKGCTFDKYFGAGFGGNSISRKKYFDSNKNVNWGTTLQGYYTTDRGKYFDGQTTGLGPDNAHLGQYGYKGLGVAVDFDYEFFVWTSGTTGGRFFVKFASFSLAKCNDVESKLTDCTINENFYGGGSLGEVTGTAKSVLDGCTVKGNVFGGGYSAELPKIQVRNAGFSKDPKFNNNSGMFEPGEFSGTTEFTWKNATEAGVTLSNGGSGSNGTNVYTSQDLTTLGQVEATELTIMGNTKVTGNIYGGGDESSVNGNTKVDILGTDAQTGITNVYGGGNTADVEGDAKVYVKAGLMHDVYGGGRGQTTIVKNDVEVNIGKGSDNEAGEPIISGDVYGGSALGAVNAASTKDAEGNVTEYTPSEGKTTTVNIYKGNITGSVYGGGLGQLESGTPGQSGYKPAMAAQNFGHTTVNVEGGKVSTAVYGGSNVNGVLKKNATVTIIGGNVGTLNATNPNNVVFGGGYGQPTLVEGDVEVNIGTSSQSTDGATINGHVYGGGALGNVNTSKPNDVLVFDASKKTYVNLYKGTINGDAYGGGLGNAETAAYVGGDVNLLLDGAKITGNIFGCNNLNGTPKGHVKVHVKRTVGSDKPTEDNEHNPIGRDARTTYDVAAVYGGGNKADYVPTDATLTLNTEAEGYDAGNPAKVAAACAEVLIEGCELTSIEYVYGGGNAAAVPATDVTILGSYIIDYVFGGGNGAGYMDPPTNSIRNPGANVGIYKLNDTDTDYGSGKAVTKLVGGYIRYVYGGSNTKGNVRGGTSMTMPEKDGYSDYSCCDKRDIKQIYGAGNEAEQDGGVTMVLGCVDNMDYVYGGAKNANVKGGVDLVVTSGHFKGVFGGNDTSGTIQGPITVTIEETGCDPLIIDDLYLGGNLAPYSVYGYRQDGDNLVARTSLLDGTAVNKPASPYSETQLYRDPILNVVSCTNIGNVFGGGYGAGATMYGSPTVNINMIPGKYGTDSNSDGTPDVVGIIGNVYGGGNAADVVGDTQINICTESTVAVRTNMGAEIPEADRISSDVQPAYITGDVFGAGKGDADHVEYATVTGNTTIMLKGGSVAKSVYGGGELSQVDGNTYITVTNGEIGNPANERGGEEIGNVYGGGKGNTTNVVAGLIKGNTNVTISGGSIYHNIYGGGAYGSVGTYTYNTDNSIKEYSSGGTTNITITGGTIGINGKENGMVFGSSRGDVGAPGSIHDMLAWVYDANVTISNNIYPLNTSVAIKGSIYGSGENGHTLHDTHVIINNGIIGVNEDEDVVYKDNLENPDEVTFSGKDYNYPNRGNVYGGGCGTDTYIDTNDGNKKKYNPLAGIVRHNATVEIRGGLVVHNVYGAGAMGSVTGNTKVSVLNNAAIGVNGSEGGNVYGAARGEIGLSGDYASVANSEVEMKSGAVKNCIFGGGQAGIVKGAVNVSLTGGTVSRDVYGGGALAQTNTQYASGSSPKNTYKTTVTLAGTTIIGNLYGGGLGQKNGVNQATSDIAANVNGPVMVTVTGGKAANVFGCNNINGAPQNTVTVNIEGTANPTSSNPYPIGNVYGGGNQAAYLYTDTDLEVKISGGTMNNVFGGGLSADVAGGIAVKVNGGTVVNDVYGGGALANTNTANWDVTKNNTTYEKITATLTAGTSVVAGLYKKDGNNYILQGSDAKAEEGAEYYRRFDTAWAEGKTSASNTTTVTLTGGTIGNVFGGGLGNDETPVYVYGDVTVHLNKATEIQSYGGTGASFTREIAQNIVVDGTNYPTIPITGKIFGANNFNGSPKGNVTVEVWATKRVDGKSHVLGEYEVHGVYGGGNLADYLPAKDKETKVMIHGCSDTSIEYVYGGGNSASVPSTDVTIYGSFDIGYAFGGGNGSKPVKNSAGTWIANGGAMVTGNANISARGGRIGQVFGGSDAKGDILGNSTADIQTTEGQECTLILTRLFGAGNEADVAGDVNLILSGCTSDNVQFVHGGSYNAHITGDVNLTITSGFYTNVFGGNDARGSIGGNINVNIEETDKCKPIVIHHLVGGGNEAPYPGTTRDGTEITTPGKVTVNIKSATRIDQVFGGGYKANVNGDTEVNINMMKGSMAGSELSRPDSYTGDAIPNVHITEGKTYINDAIGTIGNVYGGGNEGNVIGSSTVNIGTASKIKILKRNGGVAGGVLVDENGNPVYDGEGKIIDGRTVAYVDADVRGAHITGDVFGGGNLAYVTGNTNVIISKVDLSALEDVKIDAGSVYGGGSKGDVHGNTNVTMSGGYVYNGIFGGGLEGSVGTYERDYTKKTDEGTEIEFDHSTHTCLGKPTVCTSGGTCTVVVNGGQIGPVEVATEGMPNPHGWVWGGGCGLVEDPADNPDMHFAAYVNETDVTIGGTAFIMEGVIGGGEFGRVLHNTLVKIEGGQIGVGAGQTETVGNVTKPKRYDEAQFINPAETGVTTGNALVACSHYDYGNVVDGKKEFKIYDPYADNYLDLYPGGSTNDASNGGTWIGIVCGGGSGYMPYEKSDGSGYDWCRSAGLVEGNSEVRITGGHILSNVYGANEYTDVLGNSKVTMSGGTIGVPRTLEEIAKNPLIGYLFGAGKGDARSHFDSYNNVKNTEVVVSGGIIYGSVLGGAEDGHVLGNTSVTISGGIIGTWGTSYYDGNVFGGGRGFSGENLIAGSVGGNASLSISGGKILGSVYGGGRLASVGIDPSVPVTLDSYGQLVDDGGGKTYGHITMTISGGIIGGGRPGSESDLEDKYYDMRHSGNVFGGSMGRLELLDGTRNPLWPKLAVVKLTDITISSFADIKNNVYGGSEYGIVRNQATLNMTGGTVGGSIFGGGYGSDDQQAMTITAGGYNNIPTVYYTFTPMQWAGCVSGNTFVNVSGGTVAKNVYGGGDMASVGLINYNVVEDEEGPFTYKEKKYSYSSITKHDNYDNDKNTFYDFGLSWPYEFQYIAAAPNDPVAISGGAKGGKCTVSVSGEAIIGTKVNSKYEDNTGYVFGGSKGKVWFGATEETEQDITTQRYTEAFMGNVRETDVTIGGGTMRTVYGGGDDGHVEEDTKVTINNGTIENSVFGGGKGVSTYKAKLLDLSTGSLKGTAEDVHSWTAGKVYGNTEVTMNGGTVHWFIYGGGNMASVGKGNYAGGSDDYSTAGYGELPNSSVNSGKLWTTSSTAESETKDDAYNFLNSGKTTVTIMGGNVGSTSEGFDEKESLPYGSVFGGSRGQAAADCKLSPRYKYVPDFFLGYVNKAIVNIGGTSTTALSANTPNIYGSVYGGGQDGHVRNSTEVKIFKGNIAGQNEDANARSGHVFGAGSGIGKYTVLENAVEKKYCNSASGSVTCTTQVDIFGGSIAGNVYGGGALASVGPPYTGVQKDKNGKAYNEYKTTTTPYDEATPRAHGSLSYNKVTIEGGSITGSVYGASRGPGAEFLGSAFPGGVNSESTSAANEYNPTKFATSLWTEVNIKGGTISDNVYGGGEMGQVKESTVVNLTGGNIAHDAYGGGKGTVGTNAIVADVGGNTTIELNNNNNGGDADVSKTGCIVERIFGCNDLNGTPKGHALVHVYATQNKNKNLISEKIAPPAYSASKGANEEYKAYLQRLINEASQVTGNTDITTAITEAQSVLTSLNGVSDADVNASDPHKNSITTAANKIIAALKAMHDYDVQAVYGGGDLAIYEPTNNLEEAEVIIEGCNATSIKQVYGGGNAAPVPATDVLVKSCFIIDELFGGGNGKDNYLYSDDKWYENPGANVGYRQFSHYVKSGETDYNSETHGTGTEETPYKAIENDDATTPEARATYKYGRGIAQTLVNGGHIHTVYGGSNMKGNISNGINLQLLQSGTCTMITDEAYASSKSAETDAETNMVLDCVKEGGTIYGGSYNADLNNDVNILITNGHYDKIFGGNNQAGTINGKITITIQEAGCTPITIGELYGGGYLAPYSIYGYSNDETNAKDADGNDLLDESHNVVKQRKPFKPGDAGALTTPYWDPRINIVSATKIDKIFGGGYGVGATMIGSPRINVNMEKGIVLKKYAEQESGYATLPADQKDAVGNQILPVGTIGDIYGGGNLADVIGNTSVEIGTGRWISAWDENGNAVWETTNASGEKFTYKLKTAATYYTQEECDAYNATITGALNSTDALTAEQAAAYNEAIKPQTNKVAGNTLSASEANAYNATLVGARNTNDAKIPAVWEWYNANFEEAESPSSFGRNAATITGNVFGGGKGKTKESGDGAFKCEVAMVGADGEGLKDANGGTTVTIANGSVGGSVYGGGELGRVEKNTVVTIGIPENTTNEITIAGNVFGAGKGVATHGYAALVRGNSTVTIQGKSKVGGSVFGGGEIASVGRYNVDANGLPQSLANEKSGNCTVIVRDDAEIGPDDMAMFHVDNNGVIVANDKPDNAGHVFGAGMGATPYKDVVGNPYRIKPDNTKQEYTDENTYLSYIETLGLATQTNVTIGGNAFVKGDVFGGAEQGFVQHDTHVTIEGNCQIGNGYVQMDDDGTYLAAPYSLNRRYTDEEWTAGHLIKEGETNYSSSLPECASWTYAAPYSPYDKFANASGDLEKYENGSSTEGGRRIAYDGHTFYGSVFGGGSGFFPYKAGKWHWKAGNVGGNTLVEIKGGHILTNVYGGNEMTSVEGKCKVTMTGGTVGVPRTLGQILNHPVTCYLFGAGQGDTRIFFNKQTNVQDAEVNVTGGWIYGSVFGGGEDGHVLRNVTMNISSLTTNNTPTYADYYAGRATKIGTWGTSYTDGNVFGGGRGFGGDAYTAGNVAGAVTMTISGGEILGSVYGGGRLGSVGYGLYDADTDGYGMMREDHKMDNGNADGGFFNKGRGRVNITINGGTIGNTNEFIFPQAGNIPDGLNANFKEWDDGNWTTWKNHNNVPKTEYDSSTGRLTHTKGGNVYAGGMGRYYQLDNTTPITAVDWWKVGNVKSTSLTIGGDVWIMGNVYGGGELGAVTAYTDNTNAQSPVAQGGTTTITITGGTIGTEITGTTPVKETVPVPEDGNSYVKYTFGSVFGGGMGMEVHDDTNEKRHGGEVNGNTAVSMSGVDTKVRASVFGGGEIATVGGNTNVTINGGEIGRNEVRAVDDANAGYVMFGGATMGNVYGGGKGLFEHTFTGQVKGNTNVTINAGEAEGQPFIYHNVYGGGALASVGTFDVSNGTDNVAYVPAGIPFGWTENTGTATVTINGGTIGISGRDNGMVNGSSRGDIEKPNPSDRYDKLAWVNNTIVTIGEASGESDGPHIKGSVYGGGENGHNAGNATVTVNRGTIGIAPNSSDAWATFANEAIAEKAEITRGNVYGAGCGTDTYKDDNGEERHNPWAGMVSGNTTVNIKGGYITQNVYGAGSLASVGTITSSEIHRTITDEGTENEVVHGFALSWPYKFVYAANTGKATVNITGGHLGVVQEDGTYTGGDVYGSARGEAANRYEMALQAKVKETEVNITYDKTADIDIIDLTDPTTQCITGSVHGSGENGFVYEDTHVTLNKGLIVHSIYGGGKGKGTYKKSIKILADGIEGSRDQKVYGLLSGKVLGNTYVTMNDGHVMRNVYGGGNVASVGKGNYAGGADDYYPAGYGETLTGNLWDNVNEESKAFLSSGKTKVEVLGGKVGYVNLTDPSLSIKDNLPYGNVIGGSAGESAPNIEELPRYLYSPAFFSGYVNETDVTIGKPAEGIEGQDSYVAASGPLILGSVYGGGQDGHVRRDTHVTVYAGEIGLPFTDETDEKWRTVFGRSENISDELDNPQWMFRGNVFGGGSGISLYEYDFNGDGTISGSVSYHGNMTNEKDYSTSSGSVTRFTTVDIKGGTIHRNVYGGSSLGSVGAPLINQDYLPYKPDQANIDGKPANGPGRQSMCTVTIGGAGKVTIGTSEDYQAHYGGEVYGACRGDATLDPERFANSIWTKVWIKDGAIIQGNVFGAGDAGMVKKDSEVIIGEAKTE